MNKTIPSFIGITVLLLGVAVGVFMLQQRQVFRLSASPDKQPKEIVVTNISDSSFTVTWLTDSLTSGFLHWGKSDTNNVAQEKYDIESQAHSVTIHNLDPETVYKFTINSGGEMFYNNGTSWQVKTAPKIDLPQDADFASGKVVTENGESVYNALVFIKLKSETSTVLSTVTSAEGEWLIPISSMRSIDLQKYVMGEDKLLSIIVKKSQNSVASAEVIAKNANPTPTITIGKSHDFSQIEALEKPQVPQAKIELPKEKGLVASSVDEQLDVNIKSVEDGEIIFTQQPEFFGNAPAGENLTITVESENPMTGQLTVDNSGFWSWSPPENLEEGSHTITLSWTDINGVVQSIKKNFVVYAQSSEPSFESTPSATPRPTSSPIAQATPTPTPVPTASPTPTSSPTASPTASPSTGSALPNAGTLTPTWVLAILGIMLLSGGIYLSIKQ